MKEFSSDELKQMFDYKDGQLIWKSNGPTKSRGKVAGCVKAKGYRYVGIDGEQYRVHRLIYAMFYDCYPKLIDHIDSDRLNNRIENLVEISNSENLRKAPLRALNISGVKGLFFSKSKSKWLLRAIAKYDRISLGEYASLETAIREAKAFYGDEFKEVCSSEIFKIFG
jgi:hypothetical protein